VGDGQAKKPPIDKSDKIYRGYQKEKQKAS
jgi:hypothetical protein